MWVLSHRRQGQSRRLRVVAFGELLSQQVFTNDAANKDEIASVDYFSQITEKFKFLLFSEFEGSNFFSDIKQLTR